MEEIILKTSTTKEVVDITERVNYWLRASGSESGIVNLFLTHTTAALTTADLEPGTDLDMLDAYEVMLPKISYRHEHDPAHAGDHILSSLIGASLTIPVNEGKLLLGVWQRIFLVEFAGPKARTVIASFISF